MFNKSSINIDFDFVSNEINFYLRNLSSFAKPFKMAILKGFDIMKEPILNSIFMAKNINTFISMESRLRILLPNSCVLYGVIDDKGILEDNEIFV